MATPDHGITPAMVSNAAGGVLPESTPGLGQIIEELVWACRRHCGWHIWPSREDVAVLDGPGTRVAQLKSLYVTEVSEVVEDGVTLPADAYTWSENGWVTRTGGRLWTGEDRGMAVSLTHGYDQADVADIVGMLCGLAARAANNPYARNLLRVGERQEGWSPTGNGAALMLGGELAVLAEYRISR